MVKVIEAVAVIDDVVVSVPLIVTVYVPFAAVLEEPEEVEAQPETISPAEISSNAQAARASPRERRRPKANKRRAANTPTAGMLLKKPSLAVAFLSVGSVCPAYSPLPTGEAIAVVPQADDVVFTVRLAMTADVPVTEVLAIEKQTFALDALLETVHVMDPV
jgi:hypothetical protein